MNRIALLLPAVVIMVSCAASNDAVEVRNLEVVRAVFSEIWSKGNVDLITDLFSEDFVGHFPAAETVHGHEGLAAQVIAHRRAFPDWTEEVEDEILDGDRVAIRFTSRGTNMETLLGNPPTGKSVAITEVAVFKLVNGKISEQWVYPDILSLQRQLELE
ncbi:MAG TPA: ester cyclase [Acidobacteriota bacterium]|nr:ester cyclase [Acidobacteriota bacterium]